MKEVTGIYKKNKGQQTNKAARRSILTDVQEKKTVYVKIRRGLEHQQAQGIEIIARMVKEIIMAQEREDVIANAGIAVGYANAMQKCGLLSEDELAEMIEMLEQIGEDALDRTEKQSRRPFLFRTLFKKVAK